MKNNYNFKSLFRTSLVALCLLTLGVGNVWAAAGLKGSWDSWTYHDISSGSCEVTLPANTEYEFVIDVDGTGYSYTNQNFTNTSTSFQIYSGNGNCKITTGEAGKYIFKTWYDNGRYMAVYYPQARLTKQKYIYFDARNQTNWNSANFDARFWFKYYDSGGDNGSVDCNKGNALENWVYYAVVPNHDYIGQVQLNRLNPSDHNDIWCTANIAHAKDRTSSAQNCLKEESGKADYCIYWTPQWTTYCPPMSSVTLADNGTTTWGGNGSSSTPYLVPTEGDIKVHVTASASALNDANMTKYFLFKKAGSAVGSGSSSTEKTITASGTTGTKEAVIVEAYNYYNSTEGTHLASSAIYYEARTPYTISYNAGTGGSGSRASETKLKGVNFTLPSSAVFERTGYTQTGWTTSNLGTQTHAFGASYSGDAAQTFYPAWTPKTYTINLANMLADDAGTESVEVTYDASTNMTSTITKPTKAHYDFGGYYTSEDVGETLDYQLIDEDGNWVKDVTGYTSNDGEGHPTWVHDYAITLYAKWTEHDYTITLNVTPTHVESSDPATGGTIQINSSSVTSVNAHFVSETAEITAVPSSPAYVFKEWQFSKTGEDYDVYVSPGHGYTSSSNPITIKAEHAGTLTAVFEPRYCMVGSKSNTSAAGNGMPGWSDYNNSATFFNVISTSPSINLTCTCTLDPNTQYKFQVHDRKYNGGTNYGYAPAGTTLPAGDSFLLDDANNDVYFDTKGRGTYVFKINNITESSGQYYPTVTIERPTSWQVSLGEGYVDIDGTTHSNSTTGGTMSATATESGTTVAITNGQYITNGGTLSYSNTPNTGFTFSHWYGAADFSGGSFDFTSFTVTSAPSVYAKFVETSTSVTLSNDGHGKVQIGGADATSTTCGVTTTRSIAAVANSGYSFTNWTTSASPDFGVASSTSASTTLTGHGAGTAGTLTANFTANNYTVDLENQGATSAGTTSVSVTYDASTNLTSSITCPTKTHYTFGGYFTEAGGAGTQLINADGSWKESVAGYTSATKQWIHVGDITLYAKWTENLYTVNVAVSPAGAGNVQVNSSNVTSVTNVGYATHSSVMTAVPTNAAWVFKEWQKTSAVNLDLEHHSTTGTTMEITATAADQTLTAVFQKRYELVGSVWDDSSPGGMPGWEYDGTGEFTINSFTAVDTENGVDLSYTCTLTSNTAYKLRINDRGASAVYGKNDPSADYYTLPANASAELSDYGDGSEDVWIQTGDASGLFTFRITKMRNAGEGNRYYPTLSVDRPQQVNFGWKYINIGGSLTSGDVGGTVAVAKQSDGSAVSNGAWLPYGTIVTYTATPTSGYTVNWHSKSDYSDGSFSSSYSYDHPGTSTGNGYAKFIENATTVDLATDGHGHITIGGSTVTSTTCGVTTTRQLTAVPNTGYSFSSWTKVSGDDISISSTSNNPTTLRGLGSGLSSGQEVRANFTADSYSITLDNDHGNPSNNGSATATYDATSLSVSSHATFSGWTLLGYWNNTGVQTANADGSLIANVGGYTGAGGIWTRTSDATLYAHWSRSITLDDNGGSADGSVTVNYNQTTTSSVSAPTRNGYSVEGYYAEAGCTHKVMNTDGSLVNYTGYVTDGKWVHQTATTLYAKWNANSYTVTLHNDHEGESSEDGTATVTYNATSLTVSKHATFDGWTLLGYWNSSAVQVAEADGTLKTSVTNFTDGSAHWTKADNADLWAHWSRTITLNDNVEQRHNGSVSVTYKGAAASHTAPKSREGYTLDGYYAEAGCSTKVMNANGTLVSGVSGYTDGSGNWTNKTASTLYAKWTSDHFIIYRSGDKAGDPRATGDDVESYGGGTIAKAIEYRMKVHTLDQWYSLCLPFTVTAVKVWDETDGEYYDLVPYYRETVPGTLQGGHYIIRTPKQTTDLLISEFGDWRDPTYATGWLPSKNTPYIIQWHMLYFQDKYISFFSATGESIPTSFSAGSAPTSDNVVNVCYNNSMTTGSVTGAYVLVSDYGEGAWLRGDKPTDNMTIPPFECFIRASSTATGKYLVIRRDMTIEDTPTDVPSVTGKSAPGTNKVLLNGQLYIIRGDRMYTIQGTLVEGGK